MDEKQPDKALYARCRKIFNEGGLIQALIIGMKNEVSFVRMHFIQFVCDLIRPMHQILNKSEEFTKIMQMIIDSYCDLLSKVDVTLYSSQREQQNILSDERHAAQ